MKKATAILLLLFLTLSLSLPAYGATTSSGQNTGHFSGQGPGMGGQQGMGPGNGFASQLASLVTAGTITQAQADAVEAALKPAEGETPGIDSSTDPSTMMETKLAALVEAGTITQAQEEAILEALQPPAGSNGQGGMMGGGQGGDPAKTALDKLVSAGTITSDLEETILAALKPAEGETPGSSTIETKLAALVTASTITEEQEQAILEALKADGNGQGQPGQPGNGNGNATGKGNGHHIKLQIGSNMMTVGSNQQEIDPGYATAPVIKNGTTYVPIRAIVENWGGTVSYESASKTLTITLGDNTVEIVVGSTTATVNGETVTISNPAYISSTGRTMVPIRFLAESLDLTVNWDADTKSIDIQ